jgi:hypothetical protein
VLRFGLSASRHFALARHLVLEAVIGPVATTVAIQPVNGAGRRASPGFSAGMNPRC